jgi:hypothetical protein
MWSKIDDKLHSSQQAHDAGLEALGLWTICESWIGDQLTDGFVPAWWVFQTVGKRKAVALADKLVAVGAWERAVFSAENCENADKFVAERAVFSAENGWLSVGYLERNKSREWVLAERAKAAKRQAKWREDHRDDGDTDDESNAVSNAVRNAYPDPTRPDQTLLKDCIENTDDPKSNGELSDAERAHLTRKADENIRRMYDRD